MLWGPASANGSRELLGSADVSVPARGSSTDAEVLGLRVGLLLLQRVLRRHPTSRVHIFGDNLAVVRFGAGTASLHLYRHVQLLQGPLSTAVGLGWSPAWTAVRRRFNTEADAGATAARDRRVRDAAMGLVDPTYTFSVAQS